MANVERNEVRALLDEFERDGLPEVPPGVGYSWLAGLYSFANGGDMNHRGRRLNFDDSPAGSFKDDDK